MGYGDRGRRLYAFLDAAAAVENLMLAAHSLGLSTCWIGAYRDEEVIEVLELPEGVNPIAIIPLGFPGETPHPPSRIRIDRVTFLDRYGAKWSGNSES